MSLRFQGVGLVALMACGLAAAAGAPAGEDPGTAAGASPPAIGLPLVTDLPPIPELLPPADLPPSVLLEDPDELAEQSLSNAARVRLDQARDSIVQVRGYLGNAETSAFHGSGFAVGSEGFIVTNYHVVAEAVLHPQRFRLEYVTSDGRTGRLRVYAVDLRNDLAVVRADGLELPPLRLRTEIPRQGARAYSIGFPLNLGLTITEGVANGLLTSGFEGRIHYTGAINGGMSGGPALDAGGNVYGVNVSVLTGRQLVGLVVPARHIEPLLKRARKPLDEFLSARQARDMVAQQALEHDAALFESGPQPAATQSVDGYRLPTRMGPAFECNTTGASEAPRRLQVQTIGCATRSGVLLLPDLEVGRIQFQHRILHGPSLHPLQFAQRVNGIAEGITRTGSERHVAPFACRDALVSLDGFDARISTCARQYRLFSSLYDLAITVTSINDTHSAVVTQLDLRGVGFEPGMQFVQRFLGSMRWIP